VSRFLIDTNVLSELVRRAEPDSRVKEWFEIAAPDSLYASVLTFAEIRRGIELLPESKRRPQLEYWLDHELLEAFETRLLTVTKIIADRWAVLSAQAQRRGAPLANIDGLLAATAVEHGLTVVTRNLKDFSGLGVATINPWETK